MSKNCTINIEHATTPTGKDRIHGTAVYQDITFTFAVHVAPPSSRYDAILEVSIISPLDGCIMQSSAKAKKRKKALNSSLRELEDSKSTLPDEQYQVLHEKLMSQLQSVNSGQHLECFNCQKTSYFTGKPTTNQVKKAVETCVEHLYGDYEEDITKALKGSAEKGDLHARAAYNMYQLAFFSTMPRVTEKELKARQSSLRQMCDAINHKALSLLEDSDVEHALRGKKSAKISLLEKFLNYLGEQGAYHGDNPVTRFLHAQQIADRSNKPQNGQPQEANHLSPQVELNLHNQIATHIEDDMSLAIPLIKGFGASMDQILKMRWSDIVIQGNNVTIQDYKDTYTGGTHNYVRPPLRECADFIIQKYALLCEKKDPSALSKAKVVPASGKTALTKYMRKMLEDAKVDLAAYSAGKKKDKSAGGTGFKLLSSHYAYVLRNRCGVTPNSPVDCYLRGARIYDVTGDHYESFSDPIGQHRLQVIVDRDNLCTPAAQSSLEVTSNDENVQVEVAATSGKTRAQLVSSNYIFIPKGATVIIGSHHGGVCGEITACAHPKDPIEKYLTLF